MSERDEIARLMSVSAQPGYRWGSDPLSDITALCVADAILAAGYTRTPALPAEGSPEWEAMVERMAEAWWENFDGPVPHPPGYTTDQCFELICKGLNVALRALAQGMAVPTSTETPE